MACLWFSRWHGHHPVFPPPSLLTSPAPALCRAVQAVVVPGMAIVPECKIPEFVMFQGVKIQAGCFLHRQANRHFFCG